LRDKLDELPRLVQFYDENIEEIIFLDNKSSWLMHELLIVVLKRFFDYPVNDEEISVFAGIISY